MWTKEKNDRIAGSSRTSEIIFDKIQELTPKDENQRNMKSQALTLLEGVRQMRWLQYEQLSNSVPIPLLIILVSWLTMLFVGIGLFAPANATVIASLSYPKLRFRQQYC